MSDEEFARFCSEHEEYFFEMTAEGDMVVMAPRYPFTSIQNARITGQLVRWAEKDRCGLVTSSTTGLRLPNGARRSPDAAWIPKQEILALPRIEDCYWRLCPPFVIELLSRLDRIQTIRAKMQEYIENGAKLGWLIDPETRSVEIYRPGRGVERLENVESIAGEGPVEGFVLDLQPVWDPWT